MPVLIIEEQLREARGAVLDRRVLIGRRAGNGIVIDDDRVSRLHAWIDLKDGKPGITDARSRGGTSVNGEKIRARHMLRDGDRIKIGPLNLTYRDDVMLPPGIKPMEFHSDLSAVSDATGGLIFDCICGSPLWAPWARAGSVGKCSYCAKKIILPTKPGLLAREAPQSAGASGEIESVGTMQDACSICQTPMEPRDDRAACPACGLTFHADCYTENRGCSAYGCSQVGVLDREKVVEIKTAEPQDLETEFEPSHRTEIILAPLSVLAAGISLLSFGGPSCAVLIGSILTWKKAHDRRWLVAAGLVSLIGMGVGLWMSVAFWLG